jgi:Leucine-rich repeat (LRR) protein
LNGLEESWQERILSASGSPDVFLREKQLRFIGEGITDITPLAHCREVRELILSANELESIEALRDCPQLKQAKSLKELEVSGLDREQLCSLAELASLEKLTLVGLASGAEESVELLGQLVNLRTLELEEVSLSNLEFLRNCPNLQRVKLKDSSIQDASALAKTATAFFTS